MFCYPFVAPANKCADRRRGGVKNVDPIFLDDFPEPIGLWPVRGALVHDNCCAVRQRAVDDVTMTGHPTDVSGAPENIFIANIEYVLGGRIDAHQITTGGVQDSFGFSGGPTCVEKVERVLAIKWRSRPVRIHIFQVPMPPNVPGFLHVEVVPGTAKNNHAPDGRAITECVIDISLKRDNPASSVCTVGSDNRDRAAVDDPITNAIGAKSAEDY